MPNLTLLNCSICISLNGENEQREIVKALSGVSVHQKVGLSGCVFEVSALLEDQFSVTGFPPEFSNTVLLSFYFSSVITVLVRNPHKIMLSPLMEAFGVRLVPYLELTVD